jgi:hypothetical protein
VQALQAGSATEDCTSLFRPGLQNKSGTRTCMSGPADDFKINLAYSSLRASEAAARVWSISSSLWARETRVASNWLGAK